MSRSAGLAVQGVLLLPRAELLQLHAVGVVTPVLARDVVALLALHARQRDLGTDVGRLGHGGVPSSLQCDSQRSRVVARSDRMQNRRPRRPVLVAVAGLEPATQRL